MLVTGAKPAVTVCGEPIVTDVEGALALATFPVQPVKEYPLLGVASIDTTVPEL
jgi:hypothetical protein